VPQRTIKQNLIKSGLVLRGRGGNRRDQFLEEAFEYIANYFENSLEELERKNADVQSRFRRLDSRHFTATAYRNGERVSGCRIWIGGLSPTNTNAIGYSVNETGDDRAFNAMLSVEDDGYSLFLKPMLGRVNRPNNQHLTNEGGAEYFWSRFMEPLQC
jgi:hypothetical protein